MSFKRLLKGPIFRNLKGQTKEGCTSSSVATFLIIIFFFFGPLIRELISADGILPIGCRFLCSYYHNLSVHAYRCPDLTLSPDLTFVWVNTEV